MRFPSIKTLMTICDSKEQAKLVRAIGKANGKDAILALSPAAQAWYRQCYHPPTTKELRMHAIDAALGTYGVERIETRQHSIDYCNAGDTYAATLMKVNGNYRVGCWGDVVERDIEK